jgi:ABC-type nitrate/sulfonate/bicarbonate transport system substrate-binding protein
MRGFLGVLWAAALAASACSGASAQDAERVRHGIQRGALGALRVAMADVEAKHKLKYEYKEFNDSTAALLALEQGEVDVANTTLQHLVRAMDEGIPVVWVAGWGGGYNVVIAAPALRLKKGDWKALAELAKKRNAEGKPLKIGVPTGSMQHLKLSVALKGAGIDPDKDVSVVNVPFPNHPRAVEGGEIDMAMTLAVFGALSINSGKGALFDHVFGGQAGKQEIGFIVRRDAVEKHADYVQRIVASHHEAMKGFVNDVPRQIQLELKFLKLPEPVIAMVQRDFLRLSYRTNLPDIALMARQMHAIGWAKKDQAGEIGKFVNLSFLEKASGEESADLGKW